VLFRLAFGGFFRELGLFEALIGNGKTKMGVMDDEEKLTRFKTGRQLLHAQLPMSSGIPDRKTFIGLDLRAW